MNDELHNSNDVVADVTDLKVEVAALRRILTTLVATLLLLTLALNAVFLWQSRLVRRQLANSRAEIASYRTTALPVMEEFLTRLQRFSTAHPDFTPILGKYVPARTNTALQLVPKLSPPRR